MRGATDRVRARGAHLGRKVARLHHSQPKAALADTQSSGRGGLTCTAGAAHNTPSAAIIARPQFCNRKPLLAASNKNVQIQNKDADGKKKQNLQCKSHNSPSAHIVPEQIQCSTKKSKDSAIQDHNGVL